MAAAVGPGVVRRVRREGGGTKEGEGTKQEGRGYHQSCSSDGDALAAVQ